jgi:hypothetical protein
MALSKTKEELLTRLINRKQPQAMRIEIDMCTYDHEVNGGCAIGSEVSKKKALELEVIGGGIIDDHIFEALPKRLKKIGREFLKEVQSLHDNDINWEKGRTGESSVWSNRGQRRINELITEFTVNIPLLEVQNN